MAWDKSGVHAMTILGPNPWPWAKEKLVTPVILLLQVLFCTSKYFYYITGDLYYIITKYLKYIQIHA
jgi:hypothetical protein